MTTQVHRLWLESHGFARKTAGQGWSRGLISVHEFATFGPFATDPARAVRATHIERDCDAHGANPQQALSRLATKLHLLARWMCADSDDLDAEADALRQEAEHEDDYQMESIDVHYDRLGLDKCNECNERAGALWIEHICLCEVCVSKLGATLSMTLAIRRER